MIGNKIFSKFKLDKEVVDAIDKVGYLLLGVVLALASNQTLFLLTKPDEVKLNLQKELVKEQYPYLNRILLLTYKQEITKHTVIDKGNNKTITFYLPSFISDDAKRLEFKEEIEYIIANKDKIDFNVWIKFEELLSILENNPLPMSSDSKVLEKSSWNDKKVRDKWCKLEKELFELTYAKLY